MAILLIVVAAVALFAIGAYVGLDRLKRINIWHVMAGIAVAALFIATVDEPGWWIVFTLIGIGALFARTWIREFTFLMSLRDENFPGRSDKLIWAFVLVVVPPAGVWAMRNFRKTHWPEPVSEAEPRVNPTPAFDM